MPVHPSESERQEREYLEGSRYEDKYPDWRCECGDLNRWHEACCFRCGAGRTGDDE